MRLPVEGRTMGCAPPLGRPHQRRRGPNNKKALMPSELQGRRELGTPCAPLADGDVLPGTRQRAARPPHGAPPTMRPSLGSSSIENRGMRQLAVPLATLSSWLRFPLE